MLRIKKLAISVITSFMLVACDSDADIASRNVSQAADNFEVTRRIVFYNEITGEYMLIIEGLCSLGNNDSDRKLSVTCKTGPTSYEKHFLGLSDNVTFFVEQVDPVQASAYHYRVVIKPQSIVPMIDLNVSTSGK